MRKLLFIAITCVATVLYSCSHSDTFTVELSLDQLVGEDDNDVLADLEGRSVYLGIVDDSGASAPQILDSTTIKDGKILIKSHVPNNNDTDVCWLLLKSNNPQSKKEYNALMYFVPEKGNIHFGNIPDLNILGFTGTPKNEEISKQTAIFVQAVEIKSFQKDIHNLEVNKIKIMDSLRKEMDKTKSDPAKYEKIFTELSTPIDKEIISLSNDLVERQFIFLEQNINTIFGRQTFYGLIPNLSSEQMEQLIAVADSKITSQQWVHDALESKKAKEEAILRASEEN